MTNKGISLQFYKKRHNKHALNPSDLQGPRSPLLSFLSVSVKLLLSPLARPPPFCQPRRERYWYVGEVLSALFAPLSTSHSSKPFHFLPAFGAITNRWALVICCTLHCQQRSQDKWLTSSIAWRTWDCTSCFTQLFPTMTIGCGCGFLLLFFLKEGHLMALACSIRYFIASLRPKTSLLSSRRADIFCFCSHLNVCVCVCRAARPTAQRPPTMTSGCYCDSHRGWRTRGRPTSCRTGHVTPGSGTAVTSKSITQNRHPPKSCFDM